MTSDRARITAGELVVALSNYDLGIIESVRRFRGGSRGTPKVLIAASSGTYLLKRRSVPSGNTARPAFVHALHQHLEARGYPLPELVRTRANTTMVMARSQPGTADAGVEAVYETYRFVRGAGYDRSVESAASAGACLAELHRLSSDMSMTQCPQVGTFHNREGFSGTVAQLRERFDDPRARSVCRSLLATYQHAAAQAEAIGVSFMPGGVVHADWHPGNMIFVGPSKVSKAGSPGQVLAVVDFDSVRRGPHITDLANGALQFSIVRSTEPRSASVSRADRDDRADWDDRGDRSDLAQPPRSAPADAAGRGIPSQGSAADPSSPTNPDRVWRIAVVPELLRAFVMGYAKGAGAGGGGVGGAGGWWSESGAILSEQLRAIPWLMTQALIVEAAVPIALTGRFGRLEPLGFLALVDQTAQGLVHEHARIVDMIKQV